ncbi:hypothetical protein BDZ89DRAFT_500568 [Hymenopellis radicata]|nr:hypothetical protein BDZ89DRAFT_500568 [Hymenopellis radicata]
MMLVPDDVWPSKTRLCTKCKQSLPSHYRHPLPAGQPLVRLRSSIFPSQAELDSLAPLVAEVSHEVALYDEQIARIQRVLKRLKSDRQALAQYLVRQKGLSAHIRKLPPQILISIFQYVCHDYDSADLANLHPASILRAVCVKWFNITATSSSLWSHINIDIPYTFTEWWSPPAEREEQEIPLRNGTLAASQAVALSRQETLNVTFICPRCPPGMSPLHVLGQSHARWRKLTISEDVLPDLGSSICQTWKS